MSEPTRVTIPEWTWVKIAEDVKSIFVYRSETTLYYYYTYRFHNIGDPIVPDTIIPGEVPPDAVRLFEHNTPGQENIESDTAMDIYIMGANFDDDIDDVGDILVMQGLSKTDVAVTDQTTPPVEFFLTQTLNAVTINANAGAKTKILELDPGHGFVIANHIEIYAETPVGALTLRSFVQLQVVDVNIDTITVQPFIGFDLEPANVISANRTTRNMNVDGSVTPVRFSIGPPNGLKWDLTRTMVMMVVATNPDDALYGDLAPLPNGVFFGFENDLTQAYLVNIQANIGYRGTAYDVEYTTRSSGGGDYGVSVRKSFAGRHHYGVAIRLEGPTNDLFVAYVNDNLLLITEHSQKVMGHNLD